MDKPTKPTLSLKPKKPDAATMTKGEREDLQRLIRQREKVLKSAAKQRSAELLADFENQMGQEYKFDDDKVVAWLLGHDSTHRIIVASYSGDFAAELHRQFRMVIESEWYAKLFPHTISAKETGLELVTTRGGSRYATAVGGTLTGRGADLIIVDDPPNANEAQSETARKRVIDWYGGSLVPRLNDKERGCDAAPA